MEVLHCLSVYRHLPPHAVPGGYGIAELRGGGVNGEVVVNPEGGEGGREGGREGRREGGREGRRMRGSGYVSEEEREGGREGGGREARKTES